MRSRERERERERERGRERLTDGWIENEAVATKKTKLSGNIFI